MNGIVNVYKEKGFTSFDVVAKLRGIFHQKKIGHTGTLDPDATGVLPICLGKATRVVDLLTDKDKTYETVMLLGQATDTQDISGEVLETKEVLVSEEEIRKAIMTFIGKQEQIPPMYSALKVNGRKLCDLARQGVTVERKPREIEVYSIEILEMNLPRVSMRIHCSKGTYIRTLCNDIGEKLGCFACMEQLERVQVSDFLKEDALTLSEIEILVKAEDFSFVHPVDCVFTHLPRIEANNIRHLVYNGNRIPSTFISGDIETAKKKEARLYADDVFIGIYNYIEETDDFKPRKIFAEL